MTLAEAVRQIRATCDRHELFNKGVALGQLNRSEEEIATYDRLLQRFNAAEPALQEPVARALRNKGVRLAQLNRREEATATYDLLLQYFGDAAEPALREPVATALNDIGFVLLCRAKEARARQDDASVRLLLEQAHSKLSDSLQRRPESS